MKDCKIKRIIGLVESCEAVRKYGMLTLVDKLQTKIGRKFVAIIVQ